MVSIEDEKRQKPSDHPLFRDSLYFNGFDAKKKIGISTSIGLRPNLNQAEAAFVVFRGKDILISYAKAGLDLPSSDWDNICVGNVCYRWIEPLKKFKILYKSDNAEVSLVWEAITPFFDYSANVQKLPEIVYSLHYEQAGVVEGEILVDGEYIIFKGYGIRDHSAGVRDWNSIDRWYFVSSIFDKNFAFCVWTVKVGEDERTGGWVFKDGLMRGVRGAEYNLKYEDERMTKQLGGTIRFFDDFGEEFKVDSEVVTAIYPFDFGKVVLNESYAKYISGGKIGWGLFELLWRK